MVIFRNDLETFCMYLAHRPPNVDGMVHQHVEDRPLEKAVRGIYCVAQYYHQPGDGEVITVQLDEYCGRLDPDDEAGDEAVATARKSHAIEQRVHEAVAMAGGTLCVGPLRYTGECVSQPV